MFWRPKWTLIQFSFLFIQELSDIASKVLYGWGRREQRAPWDWAWCIFLLCRMDPEQVTGRALKKPLYLLTYNPLKYKGFLRICFSYLWGSFLSKVNCNHGGDDIGMGYFGIVLGKRVIWKDTRGNFSIVRIDKETFIKHSRKKKQHIDAGFLNSITYSSPDADTGAL